MADNNSGIHAKANYLNKYRLLKRDDVVNKKKILEEIRQNERAHEFLNADAILKEGAKKHQFDYEKIEKH